MDQSNISEDVLRHAMRNLGLKSQGNRDIYTYANTIVQGPQSD